MLYEVLVITHIIATLPRIVVVILQYTNVLILETRFDNVVERRGAIDFVFNSWEFAEKKLD